MKKIRKNVPDIIGEVFKTTNGGDIIVVDYTNNLKVLVRFVNTGYERLTTYEGIKTGKVKDKSFKTVLGGVGINDADYTTHIWEYIDEKNKRGYRKTKNTWSCPYYSRWYGMLYRCYSDKSLKIAPTYKECTVCEEWLTFSNFRSWMIAQDWQVNQLDKDILFQGNKVYSPETCVFIDQRVNKFLTDSLSTRGACLLGCSWHSDYKKVQAKCSNPFNGKEDYLGLFDTEFEAHLAWKKRKYIHSCGLAYSRYVTDERVRQALLFRYKNYTILEDHIK